MKKVPPPIGLILLFLLFSLLAYAGWLSYKSIDWEVLKRLESQQLLLPTPAPSPALTPGPSPTVKK